MNLSRLDLQQVTEYEESTGRASVEPAIVLSAWPHRPPCHRRASPFERTPPTVPLRPHSLVYLVFAPPNQQTIWENKRQKIWSPLSSSTLTSFWPSTLSTTPHSILCKLPLSPPANWRYDLPIASPLEADLTDTCHSPSSSPSSICLPRPPSAPTSFPFLWMCLLSSSWMLTNVSGIPNYLKR